MNKGKKIKEFFYFKKITSSTVTFPKLIYFRFIGLQLPWFLGSKKKDDQKNNAFC